MLVYDLSGKPLQYLPDGKMNNVDLRGGFKLGGKT
jgi:3-phytase